MIPALISAVDAMFIVYERVEVGAVGHVKLDEPYGGLQPA